jgi:hypothetical protein
MHPVRLGGVCVVEASKFVGGIVNGHRFLPNYGHLFSPLVAMFSGSSTFWVGYAVTGPALSLPTMR